MTIKITSNPKVETGTVYARGVKKTNIAFLKNKAAEANYATPGVLLDEILDQARKHNPVKASSTKKPTRKTVKKTPKKAKKKVSVKKKVSKHPTKKPKKPKKKGGKK